MYINEFHRQNSMTVQKEVWRMSLHPYSREQKIHRYSRWKGMATSKGSANLRMLPHNLQNNFSYVIKVNYGVWLLLLSQKQPNMKRFILTTTKWTSICYSLFVLWILFIVLKGVEHQTLYWIQGHHSDKLVVAFLFLIWVMCYLPVAIIYLILKVLDKLKN